MSYIKETAITGDFKFVFSSPFSAQEIKEAIKKTFKKDMEAELHFPGKPTLFLEMKDAPQGFSLEAIPYGASRGLVDVSSSTVDEAAHIIWGWAQNV